MKKRKRLIWQIFPSFLLITLLSLLAVSWYASSSMRHFFIDQTAVDLNVRAVLLEKQIIAHLLPLDPPAVDAVCKAMGRQSATRYTVIMPSGEVVGDSRETPRLMDNHAKRPEIVRALAGETGNSIRYSNTLLQSMMYVARPIRKNGNIAAVIRASIPTTCAGYFAGGDFSRRLAAPDSEEMAGLAAALNQMASQLDSRIKTIINQRNELETVLSSMREGVVAVDNKERIISMNQAASVLFESDPAGCQDKNIQEIVRNLPLQKFIRKAISGREPEEDDIVLYQNGENILNLKSSPVLDAAKEQIGTLVVINDVTQLRRLENMRKDFVANVSHEIKTPLTAIKGFVETLHQGDVDQPEERKRFLGIIQKHVDRLSSIIEDLLSLSRIEQEGEMPAIQFEKGPINDLFMSALQICRSKAEEKKIDIHLTCEKQLISSFDPSLLEQAVVNLLDNAIKYSDPGSTINLKATLDDSEVKIIVEDQGIGIAKKHLPRLFERFYRVDKARSRKQGGTGLGLAIVKHITQLHGGQITVESTLGQGSQFTLHLPKA